MAHSSANGSEGLAQSKNVSNLAGARQTLLLPSKLARLVITTDFTNVLEFQLSSLFPILEKSHLVSVFKIPSRPNCFHVLKAGNALSKGCC